MSRKQFALFSFELPAAASLHSMFWMVIAWLIGTHSCKGCLQFFLFPPQNKQKQSEIWCVTEFSRSSLTDIQIFLHFTSLTCKTLLSWSKAWHVLYPVTTACQTESWRQSGRTGLSSARLIPNPCIHTSLIEWVHFLFLEVSPNMPCGFALGSALVLQQISAVSQS